MAREWIETDNEAEVMSAANGIEGKIIITTATADVLDIDGENSIKTLLLKNPSAPEKIRESCIRRAKEFSWDRSASMALECYRRALEKARVYRD